MESFVPPYHLSLLSETGMVHSLTGRKQTKEHVAKRMASMPIYDRKGGRPATTMEDVYAQIVKLPGACWVWTGKVNADGYGRLSMKDTNFLIHRLMYKIANPGVRLKGKLVCHTCDNPLCVYPKHMFVGAHQDNADDRVSKGRSNKWGSGNGPRCKLTHDDVRYVREMRAKKFTLREIGAMFSMSEAAISKVCNRTTYAEVA